MKSMWVGGYYNNNSKSYYCTITKLQSIKCGQSEGQKDHQDNLNYSMHSTAQF